MRGIPGYHHFILRLTFVMGLAMVVAIVLCLALGAQSAGNTISAFTTNSLQTTDVWLMDVSRMQFVHLQVSGHQDDIPVWSMQERRLVFFPRSP